MKIVHIITGLGDGGAEGSLYKLCIHDKKNNHLVVSLTNHGKYGPLLRKEKIEVYTMNFPKNFLIFSRFINLIKLLKKLKPDFVQTWMYHSDLIGGLASRIAGFKKVIWGIRCSKMDFRYTNLSTIIIIKVCSFLSHFIPLKIVSCSFEAKKIHQKIGYSPRKMIVIPNGYNLKNFKISESMRFNFRKKYKLNKDFFLIGMVARFDKQKDHRTLLKSIFEAKKNLDSIKCILVGKNINKHNKKLINWIHYYNLKNNIILLGSRRDINSIMNALDLHILSSAYGEGFPNVLAESMACGTPCIATRVGDSEYILGKTGWIVKPNDYKSIAEKILILANESPKNRIKRSLSARSHIEHNFSIKNMIDNYNNLYSEIKTY